MNNYIFVLTIVIIGISANPDPEPVFPLFRNPIEEPGVQYVQPGEMSNPRIIQERVVYVNNPQYPSRGNFPNTFFVNKRPNQIYGGSNPYSRRFASHPQQKNRAGQYMNQDMQMGMDQSLGMKINPYPNVYMDMDMKHSMKQKQAQQTGQNYYG